MELKDIFITIVICLIVSFAVQYLPSLTKPVSLGTTFLKEDISASGFQINGTAVINSSRVFSGVDMTLTGDATVTDDLNVGSTSGNGCIKKYKGGVAYYIDFTTSTANGTFIVTSTKPTGCD
jgi:hypothetical protein